MSDYDHIPIVESGDPMVDLGEYPFIVEPVHFRKGFTRFPRLVARMTLANKLEAIQTQHLAEKGWRFKIWDAWRGRGVQNKIHSRCWNTMCRLHPDWDEAQIEAAVATMVTPGSGESIPPHTTGGAVDLTIVDENTGEALDMGSEYCEWTRAPITCPLPKDDPEAEVCENRKFLMRILQEGGFAPDADNWWHYDYGTQKWAHTFGNEVAIYGELDESMNFMKKEWAYGHGCLLPYEAK